MMAPGGNLILINRYGWLLSMGSDIAEPRVHTAGHASVTDAATRKRGAAEGRVLDGSRPKPAGWDVPETGILIR